jgi:hypothetical protein
MQAESPVIQNASAHKSRPVIWSTERLDSAVKSGSCDAGHSPIPSPRDSGGGLGRGADALSRAAAPPLPPRFARLPDARDLSIPPTIQTVRCSGRFSRALDGPPDGFLKVTGRTRFLQKAVTKRPSSLHCLGVAFAGQNDPRSRNAAPFRLPLLALQDRRPKHQCQALRPGARKPLRRQGPAPPPIQYVARADCDRFQEESRARRPPRVSVSWIPQLDSFGDRLEP